MKKFTLLSLFLVYLFINQAFAQIQFPSGGLVETSIKNATIKNIKDSFYNESWTYAIYLENNVQVLYTFSISELGSLKKRVTGAQVRVSWVDNKTYTINKEYSLDQLIFNSPEYFIKLHPERNYWATSIQNGEQELYFNTEKNNTKIEVLLKLNDIKSGLIWGDGVFKVDNDEAFLEYLIPNARISGSVIINNDTLNSKGFSYLTHTYFTGKSTKYLDRGITYSVGDKLNTIISSTFVLKKSDKLIGYGIQYYQGKPKLLIPKEITTFETHKIRGRQFHSNFTMIYKNSVQHNLEVKRFIDHYSILDELNGFTKMIAKNLLGAEVIEVKASGFLNNVDLVYFEYFAID